MNDFGPKRPMSESAETAPTDIVKAKRGRPKKKPDYDREKEIEALQQKVIDLFGEPFDDRVERSETVPSIRDIAKALDVTPITVRKMLITAGYYSTKISRKVQKLYEDGRDIQEIMDQTGLKRSSVHSYLPYVKGNYNLPERPLNAEQKRIFRKRITVKAMIVAIKRLCEQKNMTPHALAKGVGISTSTISYFVNGKRSHRFMLLCCFAMCWECGLAICLIML